MNLYRCSFRRRRSASRPVLTTLPGAVLVEAENSNTARRLFEPYAAFTGCDVAAVTLTADSASRAGR